ncbi:YadA-like family protein [Acidaminococcus sp. HCP3S3_G9_1]|uniref:YadA-like family protein n=1 Tax=Acidaminococcus sp. HCP3S3_G9_1 TaxID=3438732 RepID=UPI003F92E43E
MGGKNAIVQGGYSTGIAGGSTGSSADQALAAGYQSVVTIKNGTAVGYQATTNKDGTIAFGHDSGDVSGYTVTWQKDSNGNNDYTKTPTITENKYTSDYYNRLVKVADGQSPHDVATVGQTIELTSGNGISIVADGTNDIGQKKYKIMATVSAGSSGIDYDDSTKASVTFAGTNGTRLTNLIDARLTESSTDAVTGRQLYATNQSIAGFAKDIANNTSTIATLRKAVTNTQSSVTAIGSSVDSMDGLKADTSLNNLSDAGKQVIVNAANDAVQAYMKNLKSGTASGTTAATAKTATTTVSTNSLLSTSLLSKKDPVNLMASLMDTGAGDTETSKLKDEMQTIKTDVKDLQSKTIQYDSADGSRVTLKGKDGTTLTNVKAGKVEAGSREAVNGDQLHEEQVERKKADTAILASVGNLGERNAINEAHLDQLDQDVTRLGNQVNKLDTKIDKVGAGAAALAALHPQDFDPDDKLSFAAGMGNYNGTQAAAVGAFYRPDDRTTLSVAGTFGNGENMMNLGVSLKLGKGSPYAGMNKRQLIQVVNNQGSVIDGQQKQIADLQAQMAEMQKAIENMKKK